MTHTTLEPTQPKLTREDSKFLEELQRGVDRYKEAIRELQRVTVGATDNATLNEAFKNVRGTLISEILDRRQRWRDNVHYRARNDEEFYRLAALLDTSLEG